jgi:hypothetical protein
MRNYLDVFDCVAPLQGRDLSSAEEPQRPTKAVASTAKATRRSVDYEALARSALVARVRAAWPWLAEHRPDFYEAVKAADDAGDVEGLRSAMEAASRAYEQRPRPGSTRIYSRLLNAEVWIAPDEEAAAELQREGVTLPVLATLARMQRVMPGSRLRSVEELDA